jgi:hypothetical protein
LSVRGNEVYGVEKELWWSELEHLASLVRAVRLSSPSLSIRDDAHEASHPGLANHKFSWVHILTCKMLRFCAKCSFCIATLRAARIYQCLTTTSQPRSLIALNNNATFFLFIPSLGATSSIACLPSKCFSSVGQASRSSFPVIPRKVPS